MSIQTHHAHRASVGKYITGFILSVILTLVAFLSVMLHWIDGWSISAKVLLLLCLAIIQMTVQIIFFLHLNEGPDANWNIGTMWIAIVCVFIIIAGTWKTMQYLNYNMMGGSGRVTHSEVIYYPTSISEEVENSVPEIDKSIIDGSTLISPE
ncbi:MAG: cytochrome o ubiquinol oxidase operon protein cyoD [Candidatus Tokpelaia sp. JSC189]|nr:MAG: cytochrome o ubiquinol oxidase operon protein cyoD [Candidatus Tokpelaia sp. JSC189]